MKKLITLLTLTITILLNGNQLYAEEVTNWKSIEDAQFKYSVDLYDLSDIRVYHACAVSVCFRLMVDCQCFNKLDVNFNSGLVLLATKLYMCGM